MVRAAPASGGSGTARIRRTQSVSARNLALTAYSRGSPRWRAGAAALIAAVVLSVYKPRGMTAHGRRALEARRAAARPAPLTAASSSDRAG